MKTFVAVFIFVSMLYAPAVSRAIDDATNKPTCSSTDEAVGPSQDWIQFYGEAIEKEQTYLLKAQNGTGAFETSKGNVRLQDGRVEVRVGVDATIVDPAQGVPRVRKVGDCHQQDDCPSKCASCIGLVRVCCGGGGTRGVCLGFYGCP